MPRIHLLLLLAFGFVPLILASPRVLGAGRVLVPAGSIWKYVDTGSIDGNAWRMPEFDDAGWPSGPAPLGYDLDTTLATRIGFGPDEANKHITAWFRHEFMVTNAASYSRLLLRYLRDDGLVIYLNGMEVVRDNLPAGDIAPSTLATDGIEEGPDYHTADFISPLREGKNVMAAEVHQWAPISSDLLFDLELSDKLSRGPYLQAGTTSGLTVRWRTTDSTDSCVRIGPVPGFWLRTFAPPGLTNEHELKVTVTNLPPSERWYYAVGTTNELLAWGDDCYFMLAPTNSQPVRIWAIGDAGTASAGLQSPADVRDAYRRFGRERRTDVWLMLGDNAYYDGTDAEYQVAVFDLFAHELRQTMLWPTIGNHETYSADPVGGDFPYLKIFSPPTDGESGGIASGTRRYYSFDHANIHFVCLDAMAADLSSNGPMCLWLQADLEANAKEWLIAFWHHPPYSKGSHDSDLEHELIEMRRNAVPILEEFGVDLVLCGHSHSYERSFLLDGHYGPTDSLAALMVKDSGSGQPGDTGAYRKSAAANGSRQGAVYVVAGSSGDVAGGLLNHPVMIASHARLGSMVIDVHGSQLEAKFLSETDQILDQFTIRKDDAPEPFRIVRFTLNQGTITGRWKSIAGRKYRIERATEVNREEWHWVAASDELVATEATSTWTGTAPDGITASFYRVVALP